MNRRQFLRSATTLVGTAAVLRNGPAWGEDTEAPWRSFDLTTHVELKPTGRATRIWVPLPLHKSTSFQQSVGNRIVSTGGRCTVLTSPVPMVAAEFVAGSNPALTVTSRVRVRDWSVDLQRSKPVRDLPATERRECLESTRYVPTDGVVRSRALDIASGTETDEDRARAIYEWVVANTYRKASVRGCGNGDIRPLLETGDLGGKCADINALYVGLARAAGIPARDVYGIRVAPSRLGYASLGPTTGVVSRAQHCRAEVWLERFGWTPVDPADVRKVILEEPPGHLSPGEAKVQAARQRLFGSWEMNWIAFNYAQDVSLPGSQGPKLPYFMYPEAETQEGRLDSFEPDTFRYEITAAHAL